MTKPILLLAHGAGASSSSRWMQAWAARLEAVATVETFDYRYVAEGRKAPDRLPTLVAAHRAALDAARARHGRDRPVVLAGKSMGGRVGCHLAVELAGEAGSRGGEEVAVPAAVVCFGYPLVAARGGTRRDQVLLALPVPVLFVQGSRDALCPLEELAAVRARMRVRSELFVVDGGDHSLETRKRDALASGRSQADWDAAVLEAVRDFLSAVLETSA